MKALNKNRIALYLITIIGDIISIVLQWQMINLGFLFFALMIIKLYWCLLIFDIRKIRYSIFGRLILIAFAGLILGFLFRLQHWPYGGIILLSSIFLIVLFYILMKINDKNESNLIRVIKSAFILATGMGVIINESVFYPWYNVSDPIRFILFTILITMYTFFENRVKKT